MDNQNNYYTYNYMQIRTIIGIIGVMLPVILILFSGIFSQNNYWIQPSISHYYYSNMHFVFCATLILLGFFLILYKGKDSNKTENYTTTLAGISAFFVVIFPTQLDGFYGTSFLETKNYKNWYNDIHFSAATILFVCFAFICFFVFIKNDDIYETTYSINRKIRRNNIYKSCGVLIILSIIVIAFLSFFLKDFATKNFPNYTFYFECVALWAFGNAWLVKGSELFKKSSNKIIKAIR